MQRTSRHVLVLGRAGSGRRQAAVNVGGGEGRGADRKRSADWLGRGHDGWLADVIESIRRIENFLVT